MYNILYYLIVFLFVDIEGTTANVISGTQAVVSCAVTGINEALTPSNIKWKKGEAELTSDGAYTIAEGTFNTDTQTTTLTILISTGDATFTCEITPDGGTMGSRTVKSDVFGEYCAAA